MTEHTNKPFRLGDWLIEPDLNRLSKSEHKEHLEPKTMAVLVYLCQRPRQVVSADEIIADVWGGRPMGDNPLYKSVAKLRRALGDDPAKPQFIATVPKKGYRLICDVTEEKANNNDKPAAHRARSSLGTLWPVAVGLIAGVVIAAALFWKAEPASPNIRTLSTFPGSHIQPSYSPDGNRYAFVSDADGKPHIWIGDIEMATATPLTSGDHIDARPRWSPLGDTILFARENSVWSINDSGANLSEVVRNAYNPNWSHDGRRIVFERRYQVWVADADGSQQERVTSVPRRELPLVPRWPAFSPDATSIVFFNSDATPMGDLWIAPLGKGDAEQITFSPALGGAPVWSPNGKFVFYSSQRGGTRTLWKVDVSEKKSNALLFSSGNDDYPDIAANNDQLIYSSSRERYAIVMSDLELGTERILFESRLGLFGPDLSPDQSTLAFFGGASSGGFQLYTLSLDGAAPKMITSDPNSTHAIPRWTADGKFLHFFHTLDGTSFSKIGSQGGDVQEVAANWNWSVANGASVDPNQTRIVYSRLTGQVPVQTLIRDIADGADQTFYATLEYPRWSNDATKIVGALHVDQRFPGDVAICPVAGPECQILALNARIPIWSQDESRLFFVRGFGTSQDLFVVAADGSNDEKKLMTMEPLSPLGPFYQVTKDDKVIWIRYIKEPGEILRMELSKN